MKPHSLRKILWLLNLGLVVAVAGVGAWVLLEVRPAVAKVVGRDPTKQPGEPEALRKAYASARLTGLKWTPQAPVGKAELEETILRPDYEKRKPTHWIFSGPMPPAITVETGTTAAEPPAPEGLDVLGKISLIVTDGRGKKTILFAFSGGEKRRLAFGLGDFVRASADDPRRFRIADIVEVRERVWEVTYEVFGGDPDKPERVGKLVYDDGAARGKGAPFLHPVNPGTGVPNPADAAAGPAGTGNGEAGTPAADGGAEPSEAGDAEPAVVEVRKPTEALTLADLRPTVHVDKRNTRRRAIEFDDNTHRYFRGRKAKAIAETVKTQIHKDPATGRVIGLRITGFDEEAPADVFDVRRGDILVSINGQKITSRAQAINLGQRLDPDKLVTVVIDRNGRLLTYTVDPRDPRTKRKVRYFDNLR